MENQPILQVTLCDANAVWAEKETDTDEYNLRSSTSVVINPGCTALIPTGLELGLPVGIFGVISSASETFDVVSAQVKGGTAPRAILVKVRNSSKHSGLHVHVGDVIAFVRLFMEYKVHVSAKPFSICSSSRNEPSDWSMVPAVTMPAHVEHAPARHE